MYLLFSMRDKLPKHAVLFEKPSTDFFDRVFRDHVKETAKVVQKKSAR